MTDIIILFKIKMPFGVIKGSFDSKNRWIQPKKSLSTVEKKQVKKIVKKQININSETYHHNVMLNYTNLLAGGVTITDLTLVPQGDLDVERTGDRIKTMSFLCRMTLQKTAVGSDPSVSVRIMFVIWKPNDVPVIADILNAGPSGSQDPLSEYNHDTKQQYTILYDKRFTLIPGTDVLRRNITIKRKYAKFIQFVNASTVGTNHLYLVTLTDASGATLPQIAYHNRIYYKDN